MLLAYGFEETRERASLWALDDWCRRQTCFCTQVNERLRNWDSRGRGGGMGPSVLGPGFGPGPGRAMQQRLAEPSGGRGRDGFGSRAGFGSRDGPGYRDGPGARDGPGYRDGPGARDAPGFRNGNGLREPAFRPREPVRHASRHAAAGSQITSAQFVQRLRQELRRCDVRRWRQRRRCRPARRRSSCRPLS